MINRLIILYALFIIALKDCFSFQLSRKFAKKEQILTIKSYSSSPSKLRSVWGNYSSDGKNETKALLIIALLLVTKFNFMSIDIRTTYICPSGPGSERVLQSLIEQEPDYKCLSFGELVTKMITAPLVFPGDPDYDTQFLRISMIGMNKK